MLDIHDTLRRNHARCQGYQDAVAGDERCTYFSTPEELREYNTGWKKGRASVQALGDEVGFWAFITLYGLALCALLIAFAVWF